MKRAPQKVRVLDIEADGLLEDITTIWCFVFRTLDGKTVNAYGPDELDKAITELSTCDVIIGHNIISYDMPAIKKILGYEYKGKMVDTLIMSRMLNPKRMLPPDAKNRRAGPHGLYAWGVRVGVDKPEIEEWDQWTPDILHRCKEDTMINVKTYHMLMKEAEGNDWMDAFRMTFTLFKYLAKQEEYGWKVDVPYMDWCIKTLESRVARIDKAVIPKLPLVLEVLENKKDGEYGYVRKPFLKSGKLNAHVLAYAERVEAQEGWLEAVCGPFTRIGFRKVDLNSNDETKTFLLEAGWEPLEWNTNTDNERTSPKMSKDDPFEGVQGSLGKLLAKRVQYRHRQSSLVGLRALVRKDGAIPSIVKSLADTSRAIHSGIVNIPKAGSLFGKQMRKCFSSREGMVLVSTDSDSCQLRMLGGRIKSENYINAIVTGDKSKGTDLHSLTKKIGDLESRDLAKNVMYCLLFGGGDPKLGKTAKKPGEGAELREKLYKGFDGLGEHMAAIEKQWSSTAKRVFNPARGKVELQNGYIIGLDGRPIYIPYKHQLLVYELQSDEAIMMSAAYIKANVELEKMGLEYGRDYGFVCWYHDEFTIECRPEIAEKVKQVSEESIAWAGRFFKIVCPHVGDGKIGKTWFDVH